MLLFPKNCLAHPVSEVLGVSWETSLLLSAAHSACLPPACNDELNLYCLLAQHIMNLQVVNSLQPKDVKFIINENDTQGH